MNFSKSIFYFGIIFLSLLIFLIFTQVFQSTKSEWMIDVNHMLEATSWDHFFGTDSLGRDLFFRTIQGARVTLFIGLFCSFLSLFIGVVIGSFSAFWGGWLDQVIMRIVEIIMSLPQMITIGLFVMFFTTKGSGASGFEGLIKLSLAISLGSWMNFARLTRNLTLREKSLLYVESATAMGASSTRILFRHILPNLWPSLLVMMGMQIPNFLLFESFLTFLGIGVQPPMSSWGGLLQEGWKTLTVYPHLLLFPSLVLFGTVFSLNVVFEFVRHRLLRPLESIDTHS